MLKKLSLLGALSLLTATQCSAIIDLDVGAGAWQAKPGGTMDIAGNHIDLDASGVADSTTATYAYAKFEHPIPFVPNLRAEYVDPSFDGTTTFDFNDGSGPQSASQTINLKQMDAIAYWDLLGLVPIPWLTLNFGIDVKVIDGNYEAKSTTSADTYSQSFNLAVPAGYLNPRVEIPMTGIGLEVSVKYLGGMMKSSMLDAMAKVDYTLDFIPIIQPGIELGYRTQQLKLDSSDIGISNFDLDIKTEGVYGGLFLHF